MSIHETRAVRPRLKKPMLAALAACLVLALCVTAFAAHWLTLPELWSNANRQLPDTATEYIQPEAVAGNADGWRCEITQSLADPSNAMATVTVRADDRYLLVPTDADPDDPASLLGIEGDMTLEELAAAGHKTLLQVGAVFDRIGEEKPGIATQHFERISDGEAVILTCAEKTVSAAAPDAVCTVYAKEAGSPDVQRLELAFTLSEAPQITDAVYRNLEPDAIPGLTAGDVQISRSALGYAVSFPMTVTDPQALKQVLAVQVDGLTFHEGGGIYPSGDGYVFRASIGQGTLENTVTIRFYGPDEAPLGSMTCQR